MDRPISLTDPQREPAADARGTAPFEADLAAAGGTLVDPDFLLTPMAVCRMIYVDGKPTDWLHLYVNRVWQEQRPDTTFVGKLASELFPGIVDLDREVLETFARVAAGGPPERFTRYLRSAREWFDVQTYSRRPGYFVAVFEVVSERIERERILHDAQRRLSLAQSLSRSGIWDWDIPDGKVFWTPEMYRLLGLDPETSEASFDTWRAVLEPADLAAAEERINSSVASRMPLFNEYRVRWPDGQTRWLRAYGDTIHDDAGVPRRMLGLCIDVTDLKHLSQQAADANAASLAKSAFLATMSHELRTPLNSIIGFTTLILDGLVGELNPEQVKQLTIVKRSGEQLLELISDILDIAKVESGGLALRQAAVPLRALLHEQCEALQPVAAGRGIALELTECAEQLTVNADSRRLSQVIRNLLANAVKFTDEGSVRIRVTKLESTVRIDVEDSGIGIAPEELQRIFTPFRRSDDPRSASRTGTGLGLSISRSLVLAMGGDLAVESRPGQGSVFSVTLATGAEAGA